MKTSRTSKTSTVIEPSTDPRTCPLHRLPWTAHRQQYSSSKGRPARASRIAEINSWAQIDNAKQLGRDDCSENPRRGQHLRNLDSNSTGQGCGCPFGGFPQSLSRVLDGAKHRRGTDRLATTFAEALASNPDQHQADIQKRKSRRFRYRWPRPKGECSGVGAGDRSTIVNSRCDASCRGAELR